MNSVGGGGGVVSAPLQTGPPDRERLSLESLAEITEALLEIMEICSKCIQNCQWLNQWTCFARSFALRLAGFIIAKFLIAPII